MNNLKHRIIPVLLLKGGGLYKGVNFNKFSYVGDPINAVRIFNEKEVDELVFFDIDASHMGKNPNLDKLEEICGECFMPLSFGGGINSIDKIKKIISLGVEKVIINTAAVKDKGLIIDAIKYFGSSTITCCIDYKSDFFGKRKVYIKNGREKTTLDPILWMEELQELGVGEIILNSIDKDGTGKGYDMNYLNQLDKEHKTPIIISGGLNSKEDIISASEMGFTAMAGGSYFVYYGKRKAVLITYDV